MKVLRQSSIRQILEYLDSFLLTRHAFDCAFNNENGEVIKVSYKERPDFLFVIVQPSPESGNHWITVECPGQDFVNEERYRLQQFNQCRDRIHNWMDRVIEELALRPGADADYYKVLRENLEENADNMMDPNEPFNENDAESWSRKLDEAVVSLEKLEEAKKIEQGQVNALGNELNRLKSQVRLFPKKTWVKAAGNKILNFYDTVTNTSIKALAEGTVKKLIGESN